jgi:hypothetical protein
MDGFFHYVYDSRLFVAFRQMIRQEDGRRIYRITYPQHAHQYGAYVDILETRNPDYPWVRLSDKPFDNGFFRSLIEWFSDHMLLTGEYSF